MALTSWVQQVQLTLATWLPAATLAACAMTSCQSSPPCDLPEETTAPYDVSTVRCHENGALAAGKLRQDTEINGRLCRRWVHWNPDGTLDGCQLAQDENHTSGTIPEDTMLWFSAEGQLSSAWLSEDAVLDGHFCRGGWGKVSTHFHPNGRVSSYYLRDGRIVAGVPCEASIMVPVVLYDDGSLKSCMLSRRWDDQGETYPRATRLRFDRGGQVVATGVAGGLAISWRHHVTRPRSAGRAWTMACATGAALAGVLAVLPL